ncbi:MAG: ATP synthase F1 subunit epsilon [Bryobacteraceae bacterium]
MAELFRLEIATPERRLVDEQVDEAQIPARNGYIGVLAGHAPLLAELGTGFLSYHAGSRRWRLAVHRGFVEVLPGHVRVLADAAEKAEDIDVERARREMEQARQQLANPALGVDPAMSLEAIDRARAWLDAADRK